MRRAAIVVSLIAASTIAADGGDMEKMFPLSRPPAEGETANLEVEVGPLAPGQRVRVTTPSGVLIGTISPFGMPARQRPGVYTLPVPPEAFDANGLAARVTITEANKSPRAPTTTEVRSLRLVVPTR